MLDLLQEEGCNVLLNPSVLRVAGSSGRGVRLEVRTADALLELEGTDFMAAAGRVSNTDGLGLDYAGVRVNERGYGE